MSLRSAALALVILALAAACSPTAKPGRDTLTQRQRDSIVGASSLPGAQGVRGALRASDSAAAQNARLDSLSNEP